MHNEFTAIFERDGDWYIAYCPEIPGANGQGPTKEEARESLAAAIALILADRRNVTAVRIFAGETFDQPGTDVLVEEQLHATELARRRSRAAANANVART